MDRRELLAALSAQALLGAPVPATGAVANHFLELKTWRFHNSAENQAARVAEYLQAGFSPALERAGAKLAGAFSTVIGPDSPCYLTVTEYPSLAAMQETLAKVAADEDHRKELFKLGVGSGLPFVRVESSLLKTFDGMPATAAVDGEKRPPRIFELRTYESQTFVTLARKIAMFNSGEMQIFQRLGMRPIFFGETIVGPRQPNLTYMLSYDDLAAREKLWYEFASDPEWKKLSANPTLKDAEIVANISNAILRPLTFSALR